MTALPKLAPVARFPARKRAQPLPRGITTGKRNDGRGKPFFVRFGPGRTIESFADAASRDKRAAQLAAAVVEQGQGVLDFDPVEWRQLQDFKRRTSLTLTEAERIIGEIRGNLRLNLTVAEASARYQELRAGEGLSRDSISHARLHLARFAESEGHLPLYLVTADRVRAWLETVRKRHRLGPIALRHHRKTVHMFFERALLEKWTLENPCKAVFPPRVPAEETKILSAREVFGLLKANRDQPVVGKLVLELFGFLRCSSVERIQESDIHWEKRGIVMHGTIRNKETGQDERGHKSGRRKFRQGHRPVMWEWIEHASPKMWTEVTAKNYDEKKAEAFLRAGVANSGNVLRHSCASYELAESHNMSHVSYMMQHTSWSMTERYEGVADEGDARLVYAMTPAATLLDWEQFGPAPLPQPLDAIKK